MIDLQSVEEDDPSICHHQQPRVALNALKTTLTTEFLPFHAQSKKLLEHLCLTHCLHNPEIFRYRIAKEAQISRSVKARTLCHAASFNQPAHTKPLPEGQNRIPFSFTIQFATLKYALERRHAKNAKKASLIALDARVPTSALVPAEDLGLAFNSRRRRWSKSSGNVNGRTSGC